MERGKGEYRMSELSWMLVGAIMIGEDTRTLEKKHYILDVIRQDQLK